MGTDANYSVRDSARVASAIGGVGPSLAPIRYNASRERQPRSRRLLLLPESSKDGAPRGDETLAAAFAVHPDEDLRVLLINQYRD